MKKMLFLTLAVLLPPLSVFAGELIFGWNLKNETGEIFDMQFMPDKDYFILSSARDFQIRKTETGELVQIFPKSEEYPAPHNIVVVPDNSRILYAYGDNLELLNLSDMGLIRKHTIPFGADTEGLGEIYESKGRFIRIAIDPIRPYLYVLRKTRGRISGGQQFTIDKVVVYNYETMEEVKELISFVKVQDGKTSREAFNTYTNYRHLAVSNDGKYLALLSEGEAHIRVWDLQTLTLKNEFKLCEEDGGGPCDIKFSERNSNKIYFSGKFPPMDGFFTYNIQENKLTEPTLQNLGKGSFEFFDNEERMILRGYAVYFIEIANKYVEYQFSAKTPDPGAWNRIINSGLTFIGFIDKYLSMGKYDPETNVENESKFNQIIYPNPTNGMVNIKIECSNEHQSYEIYNINSSLTISAQKIPIGISNLKLDFSKYASGVYFLRIYCGKTFSTYKIVKKG